ncbi:hypothetical protein AKL17_2p0022 (plasmid) [Frigidibacter mobilis]|uniref:Uncharacterized protein n=1 Tax=Frigidibacter mobilis TaxID=1335048 RepID=A0A159ZBA9_9RHOB|nr:hypothetical protein AKL17_2p0022 [Frigidibacter mobilis]
MVCAAQGRVSVRFLNRTGKGLMAAAEKSIAQLSTLTGNYDLKILTGLLPMPTRAA